MKRASGVLCHISSLCGDYSIGDFGNEARRFVDFLADCGFSYWQVLPFCMADDCNSPYKSYSAFSGNPYFISLSALHAEGLLTDAELASAKQHTPYACEFSRLAKERVPLLARAAARFTDWDSVDAFFADHPHIADFCRFMALRKANSDTPFRTWTITEPSAEDLRLWRFIEYQFFIQWEALHRYAAARGISIIGDLPIYVADESSDVWAEPTQFQLDGDGSPAWVAGVPPDYFSADGQLWGNPLYRWDTMQQDGFRWWRDRLRETFSLFDGVRIDHFRGFESYYAIPATATTAKEGTWVKGPGMEFVRAIKECANGKTVIAEDLGDITPEVAALVQESGFPGMRVFQFAFLGDPDTVHLPHNYPANTVAYTGTHDNNTLLGYLWELDADTRRHMLSYCGFEEAEWNTPRSLDLMIRTMFRSHADLCILPIQDVLGYGADTRMNTPGRADGNWSYRITREQLSAIDRQAWLARNKLYSRA